MYYINFILKSCHVIYNSFVTPGEQFLHFTVLYELWEAGMCENTSIIQLITARSRSEQTSYPDPESPVGSISTLTNSPLISRNLGIVSYHCIMIQYAGKSNPGLSHAGVMLTAVVQIQSFVLHKQSLNMTFSMLILFTFLFVLICHSIP